MRTVCLAVSLLVLIIANADARCTDSNGQNCPGMDQVESDVGTDCPGPSGTFSDLDLLATVKTRGEPLAVDAAAHMIMSPNSGAEIRVSVDGIPDTFTIRHFIGQFQGETTTLSLSRLYNVDPGDHVIVLQASCQPAVTVSRRWLSVHALQ